MRLIREGEKWGGPGMEVGGERDYIYIYTYRYIVNSRMTSALRWAAMNDFCIKVGSDENHFNVS